jgi:hypothetical protein
MGAAISASFSANTTTRPFLALGAIALFAMTLGILCACGVDPWAALPTATLVTITAVPGIAALTSRELDLFSPLQLVALYFLLYYGIRAAILQVDPTAMRLGVLEYEDYVPAGVWLAIVAFVSFACGYIVTRSTAPATFVLQACPRLPRRAPFLRLLIIAVIGVIAHVLTLSYGVIIGRTYTQSGMKDMIDNPIPGWLPPCSGLVEIAFCIAVVYAMSSDVSLRDRKLCKLLAWACVGVAIFKTVSQGIREYVLLVFVLWVFCHHYKKKHVRGVAISLFLVLGILVFSTFRLLRDNLAFTAPENLSDVTEVVTTSMTAFGSLSWSDWLNLPIGSIFDRSQGIDALTLVAKYTPERAPWGLGSDYADIPFQLFVPRALWPDKPVLSGHHDFERTYLGLQVFAQASQHVFSDFYRNFGVVGLAMGSLLFGIGFKWMHLLKTLSGGRKEILVIYAYVLLNGVHKMESDFVAGTVIMVRAMVMVGLAIWFLSAVRRDTSRIVFSS